MKYISINDLKFLIKKKFYQLETGSKEGDYLIYDREARDYVGHVEGAKYDFRNGILNSVNYFFQNEKYNPPRYIISEIDAFNGENLEKENEW